MNATRKLAAILAADVAGYSRLVGLDEEGTIARLQTVRRELIDPTMARHHGRIFKTTGDGLLVEFASVVDAVRCAVEVQRAMADRNSDVNVERRIEFRVGINLGDVVVQGEDLVGDGINVAARLEGTADPGGICISGEVYGQIKARIDVVAEDLGEHHLKNIAQPVRVYRIRLGSAPSTPYALSLLDKPSIAVLPFQNMSGDPEQEYFSDGVAEDIITLLSQSRSLFVIARNSSFTYKGRAVDVKQVGRELGVRYVLEGSVRRGGNRVRVTAQLIEAATGNHLWAERYDRELADVFAVQDEITQAVAVVIEPTVAEVERQRAIRRPPESVSAWEAYQQGLWHMSQINAADHEEAKQLFRRVTDLDPTFGAAYAQLAHVTIHEATFYQKRNLVEALDEGLALARRALSLDRTDALGHSSVSRALTLRGDHAGGLAEAREALAINPNLAIGHAALGMALLFGGSPREAINVIREALRRDPYDPTRVIRMSQLALAHYYLREYETAVEMARTTIRSYPGHPFAYRYLAAALGQLGRVDEAQEALHQAIAVAPKSFDMFVRQHAPNIRKEDFDHILDGLRKAGWEG
jgi:adenylate cyclase